MACAACRAPALLSACASHRISQLGRILYFNPWPWGVAQESSSLKTGPGLQPDSNSHAALNGSSCRRGPAAAPLPAACWLLANHHPFAQVGGAEPGAAGKTRSQVTPAGKLDTSTIATVCSRVEALGLGGATRFDSEKERVQTRGQFALSPSQRDCARILPGLFLQGGPVKIAAIDPNARRMAWQ